MDEKKILEFLTGEPSTYWTKDDSKKIKSSLQHPDPVQKSGPPGFAKAAAIITLLVFFLIYAWKPLLSYSQSLLQILSAPTPARYESQKRTQRISIPQNLWTCHQQAKFYFAKGRYKEAKEAAQMCLRIDPTFYRAYMNLGAALNGLGEYAQAEEAFKAALRYIKPGASDYKIDMERVYFNLGSNYFKERKAEESWEYFRKAYDNRVEANLFIWQNDRSGLLKHVIANDKPAFLRQVLGEAK